MQIKIEGLAQGYGNKTVFSGVSMDVGPGITALIGENGAGKTTFLRTLITQLRPKAGRILYDDAVPGTARARRNLRERIGYLPQEYEADSRFTVEDILHYTAWMKGASSRADFDAILKLVDLSESRTTKYGKLSGGMKRRAAIASAVVTDPDLVVLDEPTVGLDPAQRIRFRALLDKIRDKTVIVSTHLIEDVVASADRVVVLSNHGVAFQGTPDELAARSAVVSTPGAPPLGKLEQIEQSFLQLIGESNV